MYERKKVCKALVMRDFRHKKNGVYAFMRSTPFSSSVSGVRVTIMAVVSMQAITKHNASMGKKREIAVALPIQ
ncbi:hypothetical protein GCM10020331_016780 [Ectobacillus funiculus]